MDAKQTGECLLGGVIAFVVLAVNYFVFVRPMFRRRYFRKHGIRYSASVLKVTKTNMMYGDGSFAEPVYEIVLAYLHNQKEYKVTKKHTVKYEHNIPMAGKKLEILINPNKPEDIIISPT